MNSVQLAVGGNILIRDSPSVVVNGASMTYCSENQKSLIWDLYQASNLKWAHFVHKIVKFLSLNICYVIYVLLWIKCWLMWFEILLVFILFKFKKTSQHFWNSGCSVKVNFASDVLFNPAGTRRLCNVRLTLDMTSDRRCILVENENQVDVNIWRQFDVDLTLDFGYTT